MKLIPLVTLIALAGCANFNGQFNHLRNSPDYKQCEYQAKAVTPSTNSPIADAVREVELTNMCMKAKGY